MQERKCKAAEEDIEQLLGVCAELRAQIERLQADNERLCAALARIASWEPATQELTVANDMAEEARNALDPQQ